MLLRTVARKTVLLYIPVQYSYHASQIGKRTESLPTCQTAEPTVVVLVTETTAKLRYAYSKKVRIA